MSSLIVAGVDSKAARYAVEHWHYSKCLPIGRVVRHGVWEDHRFVGVVVYGRGANSNINTYFNMEHGQVCELARVAFREHQHPVSQIVAESLRLLKVENPGMRIIISYADPAQGHLGTIYQALNWIFTGTSAMVVKYYFDGKWVHDRNFNGLTFGRDTKKHRYPKKDLPVRSYPAKFRYAWPLDRPARKQLEQIALPYPGIDELAEEVSRARRRTTGAEGQVQTLHSALQVD